jgi:hypothetical protein
MALGLPYRLGLCGSAGVTAGMASLAACSTLRRRVQVERAGVRAGWRLELPYSPGLCCSAGVTAGMASLAACSTEKPAWQAWRLAAQEAPVVQARLLAPRERPV